MTQFVLTEISWDGDRLLWTGVLLFEGQIFIHSLDLLLFHLVHLTNVRSQDVAEAIVIEAVQAVIGCGWEAPPFFVLTARAGVKGLDAIGNAPLDRGVVASIEVEAIDRLLTAPVAPVELISFK